MNWGLFFGSVVIVFLVSLFVGYNQGFEQAKLIMRKTKHLKIFEEEIKMCDRYISQNALISEIAKIKGNLNARNVGQAIWDTPTADVVEIPESGIENLSDGYHTFNELYHHRAVLFSVICNSMPDKAWKSKLHDTGDMFEGMFIVGIETPEGQATYHYDIKPYWDMFKVKELEKAPKWDGHTPQDAIDRISKMSADVVEVVRCKDCKYLESINGKEIYAKCRMTDLEFKPFDIDTRKHYCSYGERSENGKS